VKNIEIRDRLNVLAREERRICKELVEILCAAMDSRSWLEFGYSSLFDWLTRGYGYSPAAAMRRIEAARLVRAVPVASEVLGVAAMAQVQGAIRAQEKVGPVSVEKRAEAVNAVAGANQKEAEKILVELFPATAEKAKREVHRPLEGGAVRHSMNLSAEASENLKRAKEMLSHILPGGSDAEVLAYVLNFFLEKKDPLRQPAASGAEPMSSVKRTRQLVQKSGGECSYRDPRTGVKCASRYQIQIDHIKPRALGGGDDSANLRTLCRQHNLYEAEQVFGKASISRFRRVISTKP
jgi:hypothetical protein